MNHATDEGGNAVWGDDAVFDAWLLGGDAGVLGRVAEALDLDAGRASLFATTVGPETVPEHEGDDLQARELGELLYRKTAHLEQTQTWSGPNSLPCQLEQAAATSRAMLVVGRALLSDAMPSAWGLAADFLYTYLGDLMQLRDGLTEHELDRRDALALHDRVLDGIDNFRGALEQCAHRGHGLKALRVSERLVITAETVRIQLSWTREGIQDLFDESGTAHAQTVR